MRPLLIVGSAGCFLPSLIILNLFFGWLFLSPLHWLLVESVLIALFLVSSAVMSRTIFSGPGPHKRDGVIDVEGKVVDETDRHKGA
ncbi:MAG TPA: hypothetical protein VMD52_06090 [Patescibacteria group bacterium]|nr:hypothetical protein [Patescibacteria group bacterium]